VSQHLVSGRKKASLHGGRNRKRTKTAWGKTEALCAEPEAAYAEGKHSGKKRKVRQKRVHPGTIKSWWGERWGRRGIPRGEMLAKMRGRKGGGGRKRGTGKKKKNLCAGSWGKKKKKKCLCEHVHEKREKKQLRGVSLRKGSKCHPFMGGKKTGRQNGPVEKKKKSTWGKG